MPAEATIEEVKDVYQSANDSMVKALALYRDGSKLSQPLAATAWDDLDNYDLAEDEEAEMLEHPAVRAAEQMLTELQRGSERCCPPAAPATRRRRRSAGTRSTSTRANSKGGG